VDLSVSGDDVNGWTGEVSVDGFSISPADAMQHVPGEGHLHLMVDGKVFSMVYQSVFPIPYLGPGEHEIAVVLSSNDHRTYVINGDPIIATKIVRVD
jgi:hypothetical protein